MGLFDTIELPADLSLPGLDVDPSTIELQTKTIDRPAMRRFRLTRDGRLLQEEAHGEIVPEADRPYYGTDKWEEFAFVGSIRTVHEGWTERRYHGVVEFHASLPERFARYEARFTDGRLAAVRDVSGETDGDWATCPACGSEAITLVTNLDDSDLTLLCRECDATAEETERRVLFDDWLHCPGCGSGDVNIELSAPRGGVRWSCDDCQYDTAPYPIDVGYSDAREP